MSLFSQANKFEVKAATIANAGTVSTAISCGNHGKLSALVLPAGAEGTTATFQGSIDGTNYFVINGNTGSAISVTISASAQVISLESLNLPAVPFVKVVAGTAQTGALDFSAIIRAV